MALFNKKKNIEQRSDLIVPDNNGVLESLISSEKMAREKALSIPAVKSSIEFIANTVSMIPIKLYKEKNGEVS